MSNLMREYQSDILSRFETATLRFFYFIKGSFVTRETQNGLTPVEYREQTMIG